jgi:ADP-ribose pyrophosphatase
MTASKPQPFSIPMHPEIEVIAAEPVYSRHLHIQLVRFRHRLFAEGWSGECTFDVVRRGAACAILLYDPDRDSVVLIEQFRLGALLAGTSPWQLEPVGGMLDGTETPAAAAIRETYEESGLALIGEPLPICRYLPSPSASDEYLYLFCGQVNASAAVGLHGLAEDHEHIRVVVKPVTEIERLVDLGAVESCHTLVSLQWLLRHRSRLRRLWGVEGGAGDPTEKTHRTDPAPIGMGS